ncbi:MAG TPA: hypothetical protein VGH13_21750 [Xanthobacteraceae bacterium]|jgi:hypothetical protein
MLDDNETAFIWALAYAIAAIKRVPRFKGQVELMNALHLMVGNKAASAAFQAVAEAKLAELTQAKRLGREEIVKAEGDYYSRVR